MVEKIMGFIIGIIGVLFGFGVLAILKALDLLSIFNQGWQMLAINLSISLLFGIIFFLLSPKIIKKSKTIIQIIENELQKVPFYDIALGSIGLVVGLIIAYLMSKPLDTLEISYLRFIGQIILYGIFGYLGVQIPTRKKDDITDAIRDMRNNKKLFKEKPKQGSRNVPKILDTSVIIDGRIADICKTGFIEGPLVIPEFVLGELQYIADSSDGLKRNRGRRGLDI